MQQKLIFMLSGILGWYFCVRWLPSFSSFNINEITAELVFNPFHFLAGMISFFFGFLAHSVIMKDIIENAGHLFKRKKTFHWSMVVDYSLLLVYYFMVQLSVWITLVFIGMTIFYAMLSVDFESDIQAGSEQ